jgi:glycosyltransferase involved in cell wall biosynthesis
MRLTTAVAVARTVPPQPLSSGRSLPTVSVVVPCYNYGRYLEACIESAVGQEGVDVDVLIIDDASPDGSGEVAEALAGSRPKVRVIRHLVNQGHIATYNEGLALIEGSYVVLLSADDLLTPGALERSVAVMEANPKVGLVYGRPIPFELEPPPPRTTSRSWSIWSGEWWIAERCRQGVNCIHSPEVVLRTSVQRRIGGYQPSLPHSGDLEMWLRAASVSDIGHVNGAHQAYRRFHGNNMSDSFSTGLTDAQEVLRAFESFFAFARTEAPGLDSDHLLASARRGVAAALLEGACKATSRQAPDTSEVNAMLDFARAATPCPRDLRQWRELRWNLKQAYGKPLSEVRRRFYSQRRQWDLRVDRRLWSWRGI